MNREDFENSPAGKLVLIEQGDPSCYAFVPNPLPPATQLDNTIWRALSEADRALGELAGLGRTMPNPNLLIRPFIRREAVLSSKIEGTQTEIANLYAYETGQLSLPGITPQPPEADLQEVLNYVNALEYGVERLATLPKRNRREYYDLMLEVSKSGNWSDWLSFFLRGVTEQSRDALIRAKRLQDLQIEWRDRLTQARASALLPRLADSLFESPVLTIPQAEKILDVTYRSAQLNVEKLVEAGILEQIEGPPYNRVFIAPGILKIIGG